MKKEFYVISILGIVAAAVIYLSVQPIPPGVIVVGDIAIFLLGWWATWEIGTIK